MTVRSLTLTTLLVAGLAACDAAAPLPPAGGDGPAAVVADGDMLNRFRAENGLGPLRRSAALDQAAAVHSADMAARGYMSHESPEGTTPGDRARAAGCNWTAAGENIAQSRNGIAGAMAFWEGSSGHRANMLSQTFTSYGLASAGNSHTMVFARGC